jgi:hypothetical protein
MDSLLAGKLPPFQGRLPAIVMSSAAVPVEIIPGLRESHSGIARKLFAFPPESLFAFSPESRSPSPRNSFRVHPGILFVFARNPQLAFKIRLAI